MQHNGNSPISPLPGTTPDKLQPHNIEAEEALLGSLLLDKDTIIKIASILTATDFYVERHGWVYTAVKDLHDERKAADLVTLTDELDRRGQLKDIGGSAFLTGLINHTPTHTHAKYYAEIIERTSVCRKLINAAGDIARLAYLDTDSAASVIDEAERILFKTSVNRRRRGGLQPITKGLNIVLDRTDYLQHNEGVAGMSTGLKGLDTLLGGLQRSDMVVIAGRPGMGKSSLSTSIALHAAQKLGQRVAIFSLEMSDEQLVQRFVSALSGIDSQRIRLGEIKEDEWPAFVDATHRLAETSIFIDDTPAITAYRLRSEARQLYAKHGLDLLIVDYLQLMRGEKRAGNRQQEISFISSHIKALARELNIPILLLSQLNRKVESRHDKRPMLSDLRDSGSIEQDADIVIFIYRDEEYNPNTEFPNLAEIILAKHRGGPKGVFSVYFKKHLAQFVDLETRKYNLDNEPGYEGWKKHI